MIKSRYTKHRIIDLPTVIKHMKANPQPNQIYTAKINKDLIVAMHILPFGKILAKTKKPAIKNAEASFSQGWKEAMLGKTKPISELWKDLKLNDS